MPLTLEGLQEALKADALERKERAEKEAEYAEQIKPLKQASGNFWKGNKWVRPIPDNLFRCPLSLPQTTLMPWKSLPKTLQEKLPHLRPSDASGDIVEVPLVYLSVDLDHQGDDGESTNMLRHHRPLSGNLSTKLSEYTRGIAGQSRPFRPGGEVEVSQKDIQDPAVTEEAIEKSRRVLSQSTELSWKEGILLTAPSGNIVDFKVGLSYADVHGGMDDKASNEPVLVEEANQALPFESGARQSQHPRRQKVSESMFSRDFFDDDSLFGSSSSSSSDGSDEEGSDNEEDETDEQKPEESPGVPESFVVLKDSESTSLQQSEEDVDQLLQELALTDGLFSSKKKNAENPLDLADRQAQDQHNSTRKLWATTKLLPIQDFLTYIPNPAMTFPFTLDGFQQQAIARLERSESVFVAAHTSAGKTVVAEYAIALARQRATRCIYTSPIKALSNQKFRDFSLKYGAENVGLVTGDLQVNVDDSTVLIMTTEILRSMLYRGADLIRDIEFVIFDEVHYINDSERGVVWEEVIIMLPSYVNLIFLSATTPNTLEFSDWIGRTKRKPVHVVKTNYRPVPLSHNLWAGNKLHKVLEGSGSFIEKGYAEATRALLPKSAKDPGKKKGDQKAKAPSRPQTGSKQLAWQQQGSKQNWMSLVRYLDREILTPACIFSFSKKKCEEIAHMLQSLDLNTAKERSAVQAFALQTVARLSKNDSKLPQVLSICEMAQRGICVHHGGLLPILKEMVEILFSRNLIKVLLCTETFAIGVNMPCKCVVFNSLRKHDGTQFRNLEPGEYTQMAGRAGRRLIDKVGTVIICCFGEQPPPQQMLRTILTGRSTTLRSQFRLTYNMILNLLRVEEMSVESMIKRSFSEFATQRALTKNEYPKLLSRGIRALEKIEVQLEATAENRVGVEDIEDYFRVCKELLDINEEVLSFIQETEAEAFADDLLQPGRIILVSAARRYGVVRAPAIILRSKPMASNSFGGLQRPSNDSSASKVVCLVLMPSSYAKEVATVSTPGTVGFIGSARQRCYAIRDIELGHILAVSQLKHKIDSKILLKDSPGSRGHPGVSGSNDFFFKKPAQSNSSDPFSGMMALGKKKTDASTQLGTGVAKEEKVLDEAIGNLLQAEQMELHDLNLPLLDTQSYVKRGSDVVQYRQACEHASELVTLMRSFASHVHPNLERWYKDVERRESLREKVETLQHLLSNESLQLFPDFLQRKGVLRKLGYVDDNETVCVKGRVACEVNTCEELIVTEMVFEGVLNDMEPEEIVAVLSSLVYQEKKDEELSAELPPRLVHCCEEMKKIATNLGQLQKEQGLDVDPGEYCDKSLKFGLVHVVYEWALGVPFKSICELTDVQEGSIVRCITRLDELCREVRNCARVVGNPTLYRKLEAASTSIKRDIVFASSLYVS